MLLFVDAAGCSCFFFSKPLSKPKRKDMLMLGYSCEQAVRDEQTACWREASVSNSSPFFIAFPVPTAVQLAAKLRVDEKGVGAPPPFPGGRSVVVPRCTAGRSSALAGGSGLYICASRKYTRVYHPVRCYYVCVFHVCLDRVKIWMKFAVAVFNRRLEGLKMI